MFRYILLFCIALPGSFMAPAQLPMPDKVCIGATKHYNVNPNPFPGSIYTWKIDGVIQVSSATNEIYITWNTAGIYLLEVQELSLNGCVGPIISGQVFVSPDLTPVTIVTVQPTCTIPTGTITVTAPTGAGMNYSIDGSIYTNTTGIFTLVSAGTYTVTAKNTAGCISTGIIVTINTQPATPAAVAGADRTIFLNESTQIGAIAVPGSTYSWSSVPDGFNSTEANPSVTPLVTTTYSVVETITATGCAATNSVRITIKSQNLPPVAVDDYDTTRMNIPININILRNDYDPYGKIASVSLCEGPYNGSVILNSDNTITYSPSTGFAGIDSLCYFICDTNVPVLCDTAIVHIYIRADSTAGRLIIYNVITPNGDGDNDRWVIDGIEEFPNNSVVIFNRWGDKISSYERYNNTTVVWKGTNLNGKQVPDGTYYYILTIKDVGSRNGWIFVRSGNE